MTTTKKCPMIPTLTNEQVKCNKQEIYPSNSKEETRIFILTDQVYFFLSLLLVYPLLKVVSNGPLQYVQKLIVPIGTRTLTNVRSKKKYSFIVNEKEITKI